MLTLFTFERPCDESGKPVEPVVDYESGVAVQFPKPFRLAVKLRDGGEEKLNRALAKADA
jgi:hypothetical protein